MNKKNKIEYDLIPMSEEELREAKYNLDSCESRILQLENSIKLRAFERENEVNERVLKEKIKGEKKDLEKCKKDLAELKESEDNYEDKSLKLKHEILYGTLSIKEDETDLHLKLPSRNLNVLDRKDLDQLRVLRLNMKVFKDQFRNKVKKVPKQHVQLESK